MTFWMLRLKNYPSLPKYKLAMKSANEGSTFNELYFEAWSERIDKAFEKDAARGRVLEWEGVWLWD